MKHILGKISHCYCAKEDWAVFLVSDEADSAKTYKCTGKAYGVAEGMTVDILAEETKHPTYGLQYNIQSFKRTMPEGVDGIQAFLSSGVIKGIGPETAEKIVNMFGKDTLKVIQTNPAALLAIPRVTQKKIDTIVEGYQLFHNYDRIFQLADGAITLHEVDKIIDTYGEHAVDILKRNPYKICQDIDGFGFLKADKIAKACGVDEFAQCRIQAGIEYTLEQISASQGHCFVTIDEMQEEAIKLLNRIPMDLAKLRGFEKNCFLAFCDWEQEKENFFKKYKLDDSDRTRMEAWYDTSMKVVECLAYNIIELPMDGPIVLDEPYIASKKLYEAEQEIAQIACEMMNRPPICKDRDAVMQFIEHYEKQSGFSVSDEQKKSVIFSATHRFSIITGGPGRGKTTNIKTIIAFWQSYVGNDIILLAPTGRAAQRIRESIGDTKLEATTIHKMIGYGTDMPMCFPNDKTLIICDECSMMDILIGQALMKYCRNATLILVGDANQLPPVGPGNMFKDFIGSGLVPVTKLTTSFRNGGLIAKNGDLINEGVTKLSLGADFELHDMQREDILSRMVSDYMQLIKSDIPIQDVCVVSLQNIRGATSVKALNEAIQKAYNPKPMKVLKNVKPGGIELCLGDRVMQIKNNYKMEYEQNGFPGQGVFNGDIGIITDIEPDDEELQVTFDDGRIATYSRYDMEELVLAYAVTAHKVQGSEYKYILFCMCMDQFTLLIRSVLYTIVTRARVKVTGYVERKALNMAIRQIGNNVRNTRLPEFLLNYA